ncbi:hypothetical protein BASA81_016501 [Batrachochytrium salamandrivorans]|nr:hypothetical protein BASA81_016501 [Batrachochytrium salamandrivorans]
MSPPKRSNIEVFDELLISAVAKAEGLETGFDGSDVQLKQWEAALLEYSQMKRSYLLAMVELKSQSEKNKRRLCLEAYDVRFYACQQSFRASKVNTERSQLLPLGKPGNNPFTKEGNEQASSRLVDDTKQVQMKSSQSLQRSKTRITEAVEIGQKVAVDLETQHETIQRTQAEAGLVQDEIAIAAKTLTSLLRQIFTDKIILVFSFILAGLVIAVIVVFSTGAVKAPNST